MLPLELDLSPLLINRTAIYNIGRDIASMLSQSSEFEVRHRFFGRVEEEWSDVNTRRDLLRPFHAAREAAAEGRIRDWYPSGRRALADGSWSLLLDPLYVLFAPLSRDDTVVCHDLSTLTHPEWHDATVARLYEEAFRRILQCMPRLIMVSRNTADTFYANFGSYGNRVTVIPNYLPQLMEIAARDGAIHPFRAASPYFLFVGSLEARKNVTGAIGAFAASGLAAEGYRLHVVGGPGHGAAAIERRAGQVAGIVLRGYLSDEELCASYAGATGFLYPSYLEGFGVPLLEAMAFGLPCVATTAGASPEVGGPLVRYRDPDDHLGMAQDLREIARLTPAERKRIAAGLQRRVSDEFGFERFAARLLAALRPAAAEA